MKTIEGIKDKNDMLITTQQARKMKCLFTDKQCDKLSDEFIENLAKCENGEFIINLIVDTEDCSHCGLISISHELRRINQFIRGMNETDFTSCVNTLNKFISKSISKKNSE